MAEINNIAAIGAYAQIEGRQVNKTRADLRAKSEVFQAELGRQVNSFATKSPSEILSIIRNAKAANSGVVSKNTTSPLASAVHNMVRDVNNSEHIAQKSLVGEASLPELLQAAKKAKHTVESFVKVRDKLVEAFDKLFNMNP